MIGCSLFEEAELIALQALSPMQRFLIRLAQTSESTRINIIEHQGRWKHDAGKSC
jgi:hypothetical protein